MKTRLIKLIWKFLLCLVVLALAAALIQWYRGKVVRRELADIRRALREQGFKTDLADFDVTTDTAARARIAALMVFDRPLAWDENGDELYLMPWVTNDTATVLWKQPSLKLWSANLQWSDLHARLDRYQAALDAACAAAPTGPIRFDMDESHYDYTIREHDSVLVYLPTGLSSRALLALHDGHPDAAWTNLLAVTRLVTAWEPEPDIIHHRLRSGLVSIDFAITWQALQDSHWPDEKLAVLQKEWESVNVFTNLPETSAYLRAQTVNECQGWVATSPFRYFFFSVFTKEILLEPTAAFHEIKDDLAHKWFNSYGAFVEERNLMLHFRNYELELRHAIQSPTWTGMRAQPGVTYEVPYKSAFKNFAFALETMQTGNYMLPARTAEIEARRRILITAIALERYRGKHGAYPAALAALSPEFLKALPMDFMDGQPLRYRPTKDGHFVLYSIGLDGVDDGGKTDSFIGDMWYAGVSGYSWARTNSDIVWPRPATSYTEKQLEP